MTNIIGNSVTLLESSQEFKEILINQAIRILSIQMVGVEDRTLGTPPTATTPDQYYIVPAGASGVWSGKTNQIALPNIGSDNAPIAGSWSFFAPFAGLRVYVKDESLDYRYNGSTWVSL